MKKTSVALEESQVKFFKEFSIGQSKFIREAVNEKILKFKSKKEVIET